MFFLSPTLVFVLARLSLTRAASMSPVTCPPTTTLFAASRFHTTRHVPAVQISDNTEAETSSETLKAHERLEALALLSEAAATLDPRPGVMLNSAGAFLLESPL